MINRIDYLVTHLAKMSLPINVFNQYSYSLQENEVRRTNLNLYLYQMVKKNPCILLVGEAAGYRGCRLTGIPFTSKSILLNGVDELNLLGESRGYYSTNEFPRLKNEATATMIWQKIIKIKPLPLLWNAFPFHPHQDNNLLSNRTPTQIELEIGTEFLQLLLQLFEIELIIAIGNKAAYTLRREGIEHFKVRHPSYGGKSSFIKEIDNLITRV